MRGCLQAIAGFVAAIFVITAVLALFTYNLIVVATDREAVKSLFTGLDEVVRQAIPEIIADAVRQEALNRGITNLNIDEAQLQTAVATVIPPGWIDAQADAAVDGVYDYLETGDPGAAAVAVDVRPLLDSLRGQAGRDVVTAVLTSLPTCPQPIPDLNLESGQLPACLPPQVDVNEMANTVHTAVVQAIEQNPQILANAGVVRVPLFAEGGPISVAQRAELEQLQRNFTLARTWAWTLWLLPLACLLLILLLAVRSLPEWGHWWGWPLVITAVLVLFLSIMAPAVLTFVSRTAVSSANADPLALPLRLLLLNLINAVTDRWLVRVYLQAGIMLAVGVGLVLLAFLVATLRGEQRVADNW